MDSIVRTVADYALITKHSKRSSNPNWHRNSSGTSSRTDASPELPFVVGAGLGRTGTHSLQAALATLGYHSRFHMSEIMGRYVSPEPWFELARTERAAGVKNKTLALQAAQSVIDQGYTATTDYPCCLLYPEFLELTDGRVILSVRSNASGWKKSILETLAVLPRPFFKPPFSLIAHTRQFAENLDPWLWERMGGIAEIGQMDFPKESLHDYEHKLESAYTQWIETVKQQVPAEKLLVHHPQDGYPPLCEFLGIKEENCPKEDYPHLANTLALKRATRVLEIVTETFWPVVGLLVLLMAFLIGRSLPCGLRKTTDLKTKKTR